LKFPLKIFFSKFRLDHHFSRFQPVFGHILISVFSYQKIVSLEEKRNIIQKLEIQRKKENSFENRISQRRGKPRNSTSFERTSEKWEKSENKGASRRFDGHNLSFLFSNSIYFPYYFPFSLSFLNFLKIKTIS